MEGEEDKSVGLLGGSFDPVHRGHIAIANSFVESTFINELWILLTPDPPHKGDHELSPYKHRKEMLEIVFKDYKHIKVSDIESKLPKPSYTIQTINYLSKRYPNTEFYLCIGEDSLANFKKWYKWQSIVEKCNLLVAARPNFDASDIDEKIEESLIVIDHSPIEASSTDLRNKLAKGEKTNDLIPEKVLTYIKNNELYQ